MVSPAPLHTAAFVVDDHPLDTYLACAALRPTQAILIHPPDRADEAQRLRDVLTRRFATTAHCEEIGDNTHFPQAQALHARLPANTHVHHTGGDGSLASSLRAAHFIADRAPQDASCLDEDRRLLRRDDGTDTPLADLVPANAVTLEVLMDLQGFHRARPDTETQAASHALLDAAGPPPWEQVARLVDDGTTAVAVLRRHIEEAQPRPNRFTRSHHLEVFLRGLFLEYLLSRLITQAAPGHEVHTGVRLTRDAMSLELDVVAIGHYRPYVFSCTTGRTGKNAKAKAFEVLARARQIGGQTARPGLLAALDTQSTPNARQVAHLSTVDRDDTAEQVLVVELTSLAAAAVNGNVADLLLAH
ncbi:hypothetical protein [Paraconexibacter algicola]|nr:hypothetical protein [Paraconexibacter algicola]